MNFSYYRAAYHGQPDWERNLKTLYAGRYQGTIARPPATLVLQTRAIGNIAAGRTTTAVVHKNVALTNLQNVTVLQPIKKMTSIHVTAMASLANNRPGVVVKTAPIQREVRVERISKERAVEEKRSIERYRAISTERRSAEAKVAIKKPAAPTPGGQQPRRPGQGEGGAAERDAARPGDPPRGSAALAAGAAGPQSIRRPRRTANKRTQHC